MEKTISLSKKLSALLCLWLLLVACLSSIAESAPFLALNEMSIILVKGKTAKLTPSVSNVENAKKLKYSWESSNVSVATVTNGMVKAVDGGNAVITCSTVLEDGTAVKAVVDIKVTVPVTSLKLKQPVESNKLGRNNVLLLLGASDLAAQGKLIVTVEPENATVKECSYSSDNEAVVTVDKEGNLHAVGPGNAKITITSLEEGSKVKTFCNITVGQAVSSISIPSSQTLNKKQTFQIKAKVLPENSVQKKLEYSSSDPSVATVSANGAVTAIECGSAIITARAIDGSEISAECKIKVIQMVKSIRLDKTNVTMAYNTTYDLKPTVLPEDATKPDLIWSSSDRSIVTVDRGKLKAVGAGNATITCSTTDGSKVKKTVKVRVTYKTKSNNRLSDGYPIGGPYELRYSVENEMKSGKVEVHYLTVQKLNNDYLRFTFSYNAPAGYGISAFSPPNGQFFMVLPKGSTSSGEDIIQFEIHEDDLNASNYLTIKFYGRRDQSWVFPIIDSKLRGYLMNPSSIPLSNSIQKSTQIMSSLSSSGSSILENNEVKRLISACPSIGKSTKSTKDFYDSASQYNRDFPSGQHSWRISIQNGVTYFADENKMTVLTYKPKGSASEIASVLEWWIEVIDALPSIQTYTQKNGINLVAEKRGGEDYAAYADENGVVDLTNKSKRENVLDKMHENKGLMDLMNAFSQLGDLDTDGNGNIDTYEIFDYSDERDWYTSDDGKFAIRPSNLRKDGGRYLFTLQIRDELTKESTKKFDMELSASEDGITLKKENAIQNFIYEGNGKYSFKIACNCRVGVVDLTVTQGYTLKIK